jgi:hypothetical protein
MKIYKLSIHLIFVITYISALSACNNDDIKYDKNGRMIEKTVHHTSVGVTEVLIYKYDENGNKVEETSTWSDNSGHKIKYDTKGRTTEVYNNSEGVLQIETIYKYDEWDNIIEEIKYDETIKLNNWYYILTNRKHYS